MYNLPTSSTPRVRADSSLHPERDTSSSVVANYDTSTLLPVTSQCSSTRKLTRQRIAMLLCWVRQTGRQPVTTSTRASNLRNALRERERKQTKQIPSSAEKKQTTPRGANQDGHTHKERKAKERWYASWFQAKRRKFSPSQIPAATSTRTRGIFEPY